MQGTDDDWVLRQEAFAHVANLVGKFGDALPWSELAKGFVSNGHRITLIGQRGIWRPAGWTMPISITTSPRDPYGDTPGDDGFLRYKYFGRDASHGDNAGLRSLMSQGRPLLYFRGIEKGWYAPIWPMVIVDDDPATLTFTMACEDVESLVPGIPRDVADVARRKYATRLAIVRLHQAEFRRRVLTACQTQCAICQLKHSQLLDAARIIGDKHPGGEPVVPNGLSLCKIHHAAFDSNILGIRPDLRVEIRSEILLEVDGPMLKHGLQELHGSTLIVPRRITDHPDPERLEERYEQFRTAV